MPFLGQDWRTPGEQWVKTTEGWERLRMWRLKLLENLNENVIARLLKLTSDYEGMLCYSPDYHGTQPHVLVLKNSTREQKMQTSLGEALTRLDLAGAARDGRRFNYVAKLVELLIQEHLSQLSGSAQKIVFNILEEMLKLVMKNQTNVHILHRLLNIAQAELIKGHYNHLGSESLWKKHSDTLDKMRRKLDGLEIKERPDDGGLTISDLPTEIVREILHWLPDGRDIVHTGLTETRANDVADDKSLWRDLCLFHFTDRQLVSVIRKQETLMGIGWKTMYRRLVKRYGLKDTFAEMLHLCRHCNALFWKCHGHPCFSHNLPPQSVPVTPAMCVQIFIL